MLEPEEREYVHRWACLPEQVPEYVSSVSGAEPFLLGDHLCYVQGRTLVFIGYPLAESFDAAKLRDALESASGRFKPQLVSLIAPSDPAWRTPAARSGPDRYYRLHLASARVPAKVLNMLRRASRDVRVRVRNGLGEQHRACIAEFTGTHAVDDGLKRILGRVPDYASQGSSCRVLEARKPSGKLVAFTLAEFGSRDYAFYMFNFRSAGDYVPGACDLLLHELMAAAEDMGKTYVNFGLGVHTGVEFFKKKWGATPFAGYEQYLYRISGGSILEALFAHFRS